MPIIMTAELSLEILLDAINAVKGEITVLASGLRSTEERIARLETAAYTPPECPSSPTELPADIQITPHPASSKRAVPTINTQENGEPQQRIKQPPTKSCSEDLPCDIGRHLQPLTDSIAALTSHVLRIERAVDRSDPSHSSSISETSSNSPQLKKNAPSSQQTEEGGEESSQPKKLPDRRSFIAKGLDISAATPRPVFGQISTPRRRIVSLKVVDTSFGNYADDKSPFSQLPRPVSGQSGAFSGRHSLLQNDATLPAVPSYSSPVAHSGIPGAFGGKIFLSRDDA
jgi:hypothetical protein